MRKVLIAGGTGFIGRALASKLQKEGYSVCFLSRTLRARFPSKIFFWNPSKEQIDPEALSETEIVINLSGAGIAEKRWTVKRKLELRNSRIESTRFLVKEIRKLKLLPAHFIQASAIGFYGNRPNEILTEESLAGKGFLSRLCIDWEKEALSIELTGIPLSILRIGIVLSKDGGSLPQLLIPFRFRLNVLFGKGKQNISWVHCSDLIQIIEDIITGKIPPRLYNATAPHSISQRDFNEQIKQALLVKTMQFHFPFPLLRLFLGEMGSLVTNDQQVFPAELLEQNFQFQFPELKNALKDILDRN